MKKQRLIIDIDYSFDLLGIVSPIKEYKFAWHLNKCLKINLVKQKDIALEFVNEKVTISNFLHSSENNILQLLCNRSESDSGATSYLLPELKQFDYLIKIEDTTGDWTAASVIDSIKQIKDIQYVVSVDFEKLKSRENLIF